MMPLAACQAAQRKMLDVLNTVGLSDSLLRVIDRRHKMDRWLTYGGMVRRTTSCNAGPPYLHLHDDKSCLNLIPLLCRWLCRCCSLACGGG